MVSPVVEEGSTQKTIYFPDARWFDYYDGSEDGPRGGERTFDVPMSHIMLHFRGGFIYPTQEPALNTDLSRQNPFGLTVALDDNNEAEGRMYYDDGDSIGKFWRQV